MDCSDKAANQMKTSAFCTAKGLQLVVESGEPDLWWAAWISLPSPAHSYLSGVDKYFCFWNFFSKPISWSSVKMVRLRRGFFNRGVGCSASDSLLPWVSLAGVSELAAAEVWAGSTWELVAAGTRWGTTEGCLVITEMRGYALREGDPGREESRQRSLQWKYGWKMGAVERFLFQIVFLHYLLILHLIPTGWNQP